MKTEYYKPKKLAIGLLIFSFSLLAIGALININIQDGVQGKMYVIGWIISIIGMIIGEAFLLDASSYDVCDNKKRGKKK